MFVYWPVLFLHNGIISSRSQNCSAHIQIQIQIHHCKEQAIDNNCVNMSYFDEYPQLVEYIYRPVFFNHAVSLGTFWNVCEICFLVVQYVEMLQSISRFSAVAERVLDADIVVLSCSDFSHRSSLPHVILISRLHFPSKQVEECWCLFS